MHYPALNTNLLVRFSFIAAFLLLLFRLILMINYPLLVEEAYYWNYAQHLDYGYLDHPPMVAFLIKLGTLIWGDNEWGVRFATLPCWALTILFSYLLTESVRPGSGKYSVLFLSFLPFFLIHSLIITPDIPLTLAWSAALYYLYNALILNKPSSWYLVGISIGLGLLSKYTIALLGGVTLFYLLVIPEMRYWFTRKEPYLGAGIALLIFFPVIYWNCTHDWASFLFQTSQRVHASNKVTIHLLVGLIILFFTPMGVWETVRLFKSRRKETTELTTPNSASFFFYYTIIPILFFAVFSLFHQIKFNWIGPSLLAIIPWFSLSLSSDIPIFNRNTRNMWQLTFLSLFAIYCILLFTMFSNRPTLLNQEVFFKLIDWQNATRDTYKVAKSLESKYQHQISIVPLDKYNMAAELIFYQRKFQQENQILDVYPVLSSHLFGLDSLMFRYWDQNINIQNQYLLLVAKKLFFFDFPEVKEKTVPISPVQKLEQHNFTQAKTGEQFYYQLVQVK